ncbi:hypothetical protein HRbin24_01721 [bacterium HR24]|nr:hypothetical protein HRbin24_01721 [bacterium HR24]
MVWAGIYSLLPLLLLLATVAIIVAAVVASRRRHELEEGLPGQQREALVRRLYFYSAAFASLAVAAVGLSLVIAYVLDTVFEPPLAGARRGTLALGLVLALVWGLSWLWHFGRLQALLRYDPDEAASFLRQGYLHAVLMAAAGTATYGLADSLRQAFGAQDFRGISIGLLAVWGGVWAYHFWLTRAAPGAQPGSPGHGLYLHLVSLGSVVATGVGVGVLLYLVLDEAYDRLLEPEGPVLLGRSLWQPARDYVALTISGGLLWASHWPLARAGFRGWWVRHLYLYLFALLGGATTCLVAAVIALGGTLAWALGSVETNAEAHFQFVAGTAAALVLGAALWAYHWLEVQGEQAELGALAAARRTYDYLMATLGLGAVAAALIVLASLAVSAGVEAADPRALDQDWWRGRLAVALALAVVGVPAWALHWWQRQSRVADPEERQAASRRLYMRAAAVASLLAGLGGLSHFLYVLLDALLEGRAVREVFADGQWSLGVLTAAAALGPYHWLVMLEDQRRSPAAPAARPVKAITVLVPQGGDAFVRGLEARLGARVRVLFRADPGVGLPLVSAETLGEVADRVAQAAGPRVLVVADAEGVRVYSY